MRLSEGRIREKNRNSEQLVQALPLSSEYDWKFALCNLPSSPSALLFTASPPLLGDFSGNLSGFKSIKEATVEPSYHPILETKEVA